MKETYYTPETINLVSGEILDNLNPLIQMNRCPFEPSVSALLVLDMQEQFLNPAAHSFIPSAPAIVPGINHLITVFHRSRRPVILTRHVNTDANAGTMKRWWSRLIKPDDPFSKLVSSVDSSNALILHKTRYDAFMDTPLKNMLIQAGVRCVLVTGVMTHICCDTTARSSFQHGFDTYIAIDGVATYNRRFHEGTLYNLAHVCAQPVLVEHIESLFM
jgi:bifunctional isochorismate lyase / aryl carrier protein